MAWSQCNVYMNTQDINPQVVFEIDAFEITATSCKDNELNDMV